MEFEATTLHVYVRPFESDPTLTGELSPVRARLMPPSVEVQVTR